uniref:RRM domain-containing protein n=1 Tax=Ditylenchus dipsaci TaxID=166011 RepID=A0A915DUC1_9BILA
MGAQDNQSQENVNGVVEQDGVNTPPTPIGNEDRKIFVGGIAYDVTNEDLSSYFSQFGEVSQAQVKFDRTTGRSRGFAFVEFATAEACKLALAQREQQIKNKQCEIKPAKSRENKKVFVGGLPADHPEEELRNTLNTRRNFAFIVFEEEDAADKAASISKQTFGARECDVKKAVPQSKRNNFMLPRGALGGIRAYGGGLRGGPMALQNSANQWFNAGGGWPQMGSMGGMPGYASAGSGSGSGWGDWNGYAAANFYAQSGNTGNSFGSFGTNGQYDQYNQAGAGVVAQE